MESFYLDSRHTVDNASKGSLTLPAPPHHQVNCFQLQQPPQQREQHAPTSPSATRNAPELREQDHATIQSASAHHLDQLTPAELCRQCSQLMQAVNNRERVIRELSTSRRVTFEKLATWKETADREMR
jgi:hypothetical protein